MLLRLLGKLFYNPRRHALRLPFVSIGEGSVLLPGARFDFRLGSQNFTGSIRIGANSMFGGSFVFESNRGEVSIGSSSFINGGTRIICRESVSIGSNVTIAWGCTIYDHNSHSLDWRDRSDDIRRQLEDTRAGRSVIESKDWNTVKSRPIIIEDNAWLGFNVTILNGVRIGEGAVIGACSVVRQDVPAWAVVAGNPATFIRHLKPS